MKLENTQTYMKEFHEYAYFPKSLNDYLHHVCSPYDYICLPKNK